MIRFFPAEWLRPYAFFHIKALPLPSNRKIATIEDDIAYVKGLEQSCRTLDLPLTAMKAREIVEMVEASPSVDPVRFADSLVNFMDRLHDELSVKTFLYMEGPHLAYYTDDDMAGAAVRDNFPSVMFDADEARMCLAFGRPTACAFHLMRAMEVGLKAISRCLSIPDPVKAAERNWSIILKEVKEGIEQKWPSAADKLQTDYALFDQLHASLDAIRNPWRNATMHVETEYTEEEARHILGNVRHFLQKLARRMDKGGNSII